MYVEFFLKVKESTNEVQIFFSGMEKNSNGFRIKSHPDLNIQIDDLKMGQILSDLLDY